jgi:hypothetical protein
MVGLVQEQHADRARLFMQWKEMDWPLMVDAQNELSVNVVPITLLIDEHGLIRDIPRRVRDVAGRVAAFAAESYPGPIRPRPRPETPDAHTPPPPDDAPPAAWRAHATTLVDWGGAAALDDAIDAFARVIAADPEDGPAHFRLGVAHRMRFDGAGRAPGDFQRAVDHWSRALALDPNQYIWRRRIQQYGPRLGKPYPFYDWVTEARAAITARGDEPVPIAVEPSGAELARPARAFEADAGATVAPDPEGRIQRDGRPMIAVETTVVPRAVAAGTPARVHVLLRPRARIGAHWNNEAEPLTLWIDPPDGWTVDARSHAVDNPTASAVSDETRAIELEIRAPDDAAPGTVSVPGYALYNVCEGPDGVCLYRRQDLTIAMEVR